MGQQKMIRFLLDVDNASKLETEAKKLGISVSAFIRLLIRNWSDGITFEKDKGYSDESLNRDTENSS